MPTNKTPLDTPFVIHGKKDRFYVSKKARSIIVIIVALVVLGGGVIAYLLYAKSQNDVAKDTSSNNGTNTSGAVPSYTAVLQQAANSPEEAQATLDKALEKPISSEEKSQIYTMKSSLVASEAGGAKYDQAITYAMQADQQDATPQSAINLAFYYNKTGNKAEVIKWYETALSRYGDPQKLQGLDLGDYQYYTERLKELKNGA